MTTARTQQPPGNTQKMGTYFPAAKSQEHLDLWQGTMGYQILHYMVEGDGDISSEYRIQSWGKFFEVKVTPHPTPHKYSWLCVYVCVCRDEDSDSSEEEDGDGKSRKRCRNMFDDFFEVQFKKRRRVSEPCVRV